MAKRRLGKGFKAPSENEGFFDYMMRRSTNGAYDKRGQVEDDQLEDASDDNNYDNKSNQNKNSSPNIAQNDAAEDTSSKSNDKSKSQASRVSSSNVTNNVVDKGEVSAIGTMSDRLYSKMDSVDSNIKESNDQLRSINKYSEDSAIWLHEIYDLLDLNQLKDKNGNKLTQVSKADATKEGDQSLGAGGGGLGSLLALLLKKLYDKFTGNGEEKTKTPEETAAEEKTKTSEDAKKTTEEKTKTSEDAKKTTEEKTKTSEDTKNTNSENSETVTTEDAKNTNSENSKTVTTEDATKVKEFKVGDIQELPNGDKIKLDKNGKWRNLKGEFATRPTLTRGEGGVGETGSSAEGFKAQTLTRNPPGGGGGAGSTASRIGGSGATAGTEKDTESLIKKLMNTKFGPRLKFIIRPLGRLLLAYIFYEFLKECVTIFTDARSTEDEKFDAFYLALTKFVTGFAICELGAIAGGAIGAAIGLEAAGVGAFFLGLVGMAAGAIAARYTPEAIYQLIADFIFGRKSKVPEDKFAALDAVDPMAAAMKRNEELFNGVDRDRQRNPQGIASSPTNAKTTQINYSDPDDPQKNMRGRISAPSAPRDTGDDGSETVAPPTAQLTSSGATNYSSSNPNPQSQSTESNVGDVTALGVPGGGGARPAYPLTDADLSPDVVNVVAGEVSASNQEGVDAVINTMMNRVGLPSNVWGPAGNLQQVATAPGQFAGYRRASESEAEFIRSRIKAIASGSVPDNTRGADSYRASSYVFGEGAGKTFAKLAASQGNVNIGGNIFAKDPKAPAGPYTSPSAGGSKAATMMASASPVTPLSGGGASAKTGGGGSVASSIGSIGKLASNLIGSLSKSTSLKTAAPSVAAATAGGSGGSLASTSSGGGASKGPATGGSSNPLPAIDNMFAKLFDESAMFG